MFSVFVSVCRGRWHEALAFRSDPWQNLRNQKKIRTFWTDGADVDGRYGRDAREWTWTDGTVSCRYPILFLNSICFPNGLCIRAQRYNAPVHPPWPNALCIPAQCQNALVHLPWPKIATLDRFPAVGMRRVHHCSAHDCTHSDLHST